MIKNITLTLLILFSGLFTFAQEDSLDFEFSEEDQLLLEQAFMQMLGGDVDVKDEYTFDFSYLIETENSGYGGIEKDEVNVMFNSKERYMGMNTTMVENDTEIEMTMIFDYHQEAFITLSEAEGEKIGFAMKKPDLQELGLSDDEDENDQPDWTKTGKTEVIAGEVCDIYVDKSKGQTTKIWITQKADIIPIGAFESYAKMEGKVFYSEVVPGNGSVFKMWSQYDGAEGYDSFVVKEVNPKAEVKIKTTDYNFDIMSFGK